MKRLLFGVVLLAIALTQTLLAGPRDKLWQQVEDATKKGLPRSAITNLGPILEGALKDKAWAEAVKAVGMRISLEGQIQGGKPEEGIVRLEKERARAPREMAPMLDTLLAHFYWNYFEQNRWRFMRRTALATEPGGDFTTWDLPRLFAEIDTQFQKALAAQPLLRTMPIADWSLLLTPGTMPDAHRPTLYDFIAPEALSFYASGEQAAARPEEAFEVSAADPVFDFTADFLSWKPQTTDQKASALKAIRVLQDLLRAHQNDPEPRTALAAADLERLTWGFNVAVGEKKSARYTVALSRFTREHADLDIVTLAMERNARQLQQEGDYAGARLLALRAMQMFPASIGGKLCRNLVVEIESRSSRVTTERVWGHSQADITVNYRNVTNVHFRLVAYDWEKLWDPDRRSQGELTTVEKLEQMRTKPVLAWSEPLPPTTDFKERTATLKAPGKLAPGFYLLFASHDPQFSQIDNTLSVCEVWVSQLALVMRDREGTLEGCVMDSESGEPIPGARIRHWSHDQNSVRTVEPEGVTDDKGFFKLSATPQRRHLLLAQQGPDQLAAAGELWVWRMEREEQRSTQTIFFTDRAIYRPGQTIHYKGICLAVDQARNNYEVMKGEGLTVVFMDANGKEVARQKHKANDYGSFSGSFTAPRDRVMGAMALRVMESKAGGMASFRVEEYKRPKFEVTLDPPKTPARLNDVVKMSGVAMGYTGAAVDGAGVQYRVVREVRMPWWWGWWGRGGVRSESQEIAHGVAQTGSDGRFEIQFPAKPDLKVPEKDEPSFLYLITADVTDTAGETRSASRDIRVGYTALEAKLAAPPWMETGKPVKVTVSTLSLDGEPQVAEGVLKVYALEPPAVVHRPPIAVQEPDRDQEPDLSQPIHWPLGKVVVEKKFTTGTNGESALEFALPEGAYRAVVETQDRHGKKVTGRLPLEVIQPEGQKLGIRVPFLLEAPKWEAQPGDEFMAVWGTGYEAGRACVEVLHRGRVIDRYWTEPGRTQRQIRIKVTEEMRGGFTVSVMQVRENRSLGAQHFVDVPWKNKDLTLKWEHFVSKLQPGQKETWTLSIQGQDGRGMAERRAAEMVAALYDASLDSFAGHEWPVEFGVFRRDNSQFQSQFANLPLEFAHLAGSWRDRTASVDIQYRGFAPGLIDRLISTRGEAVMYARRYGMAPAEMRNAPAAMADSAVPTSVPLLGALAGAMPGAALKTKSAAAPEPMPAKAPAPVADLSAVVARKNLAETAFFFPQLMADSNGVVRMQFTMPEALTRWKFLGFAHDPQLRSGGITAEAITAKDLMVQPNAPRFLREGDVVEFTVKVSNQSDRQQSGRARLTFKQALNEAGADELLGNRQPEQSFTIGPRTSKTVSWRITVPDGCGFLSYKAVAATDAVSDGEEGWLPVLSSRVLVTESLPLPIRGPGSRNFEFTRLSKSGGSKTLRNQSLTVQMVSQPAWYAVLALPYLMEYPHECSEQTFNRLYANALARSIAKSDPKIHRVFELWRNTRAVDSPLEKNQDLKNIALEETPWFRQAQAESQARRNVGVLFDDNRLNNETAHLLKKLQELQLQDGAWPWFPGGRANDYITLYITTGLGRLRHLGVDVATPQALRSLRRLDGWVAESCRKIQSRPNPEKYVPSSTDALYLYGRSFFLKDQPVSKEHQAAVSFLLARAREHWLKTGSRQTQGHLALALKRFAEQAKTADPTPAAILASLRERSVNDPEMGMFWRDTELSWWWYHAPIETQALMIEAFDEVANDAKAVEDLRVWLLKQKQTQDWKTTRATADAVYALLLGGPSLLSSDVLVQVKMGGQDLTPRLAGGAQLPAGTRSQVEPGTGFYEVRFSGPEIKPALGAITVKKTDPGVAWGSVHWQYLEDISKVTAYAGTPLKLRKTLYVKSNTASGPALTPVTGPVRVGDELVVRIELRSDRDMEYVHLKDQRGSGTEPVNTLSHYKYQDGLAYYETTRDTASHFFIDYLPKGVYVFEYSTRVQLRGEYQTGVAEIQCMYAPEFNSHSESLPLRVR